jgi:hypothetical protein
VIIARQRHGKHISTATDTDAALEDTAVASQWHCKHISVEMNQHTTIEELLEVMFSMQSAPRLYKEDQQQFSSVNDTPILLSERAPPSTKLQMSDSNKNLVLGPRWGLTPRLAGPLAVGHNVTLILTLTSVQFASCKRALAVRGWP